MDVDEATRREREAALVAADVKKLRRSREGSPLLGSSTAINSDVERWDRHDDGTLGVVHAAAMPTANASDRTACFNDCDILGRV